MSFLLSEGSLDIELHQDEVLCPECCLTYYAHRDTCPNCPDQS